MTLGAWLMALAVYPLLEEWVFRAGILRWLDLCSQRASEGSGEQASASSGSGSNWLAQLLKGDDDERDNLSSKTGLKVKL